MTSYRFFKMAAGAVQHYFRFPNCWRHKLSQGNGMQRSSFRIRKSVVKVTWELQVWRRHTLAGCSRDSVVALLDKYSPIDSHCKPSMLSICVVKRSFLLYFSNLCQAVWPSIRSIHSFIVCPLYVFIVCLFVLLLLLFFILFSSVYFSVHCTLCIFVFYNHCCLVRINKWMDGLFSRQWSHVNRAMRSATKMFPLKRL